MSDNPYARYPAEQRRSERERSAERPGDRPQRLSVMAVLGLICVVGCIIPGAPALGAVLGLAAILGINASRGRVTGKAPAVIALVLGLILTAFQVSLVAGAVAAFNAFVTHVTPKAEQIARALEQTDASGLRGVLSAPASESLGDADIDRLRAVIKSELGAFIGVPRGPLGLAEGLQSAPVFSKGTATGWSLPPNATPVPADFSKGTAVFMVFFSENPFDKGKSDVIDLLLMLPSGEAAALRPDGPAERLRKAWSIPAHADAAAPAPPPAPPAP